MVRYNGNGRVALTIRDGRGRIAPRAGAIADPEERLAWRLRS